jgi:hypothetical protein
VFLATSPCCRGGRGMGAGRQTGDGGSNETSVACDGVGEEWGV